MRISALWTHYSVACTETPRGDGGRRPCRRMTLRRRTRPTLGLQRRGAEPQTIRQTASLSLGAYVSDTISMRGKVSMWILVGLLIVVIIPATRSLAHDLGPVMLPQYTLYITDRIFGVYSAFPKVIPFI